MRPRLRLACFLGATLATAALAGSCADPVHDAKVASVRPDGLPNDEFHHAGERCLYCHGPEGPAKTEFAVAGTIFWHKSSDTIGVDQAQVSIVDSLGANLILQTNCVGNFFIKPGDWPGGNGPAFPLRVAVYKDGNSIPMGPPINRAGSCAECHYDPPNYNVLGHVWIIPNDGHMDALPTTCPVNPKVVNLGGL